MTDDKLIELFETYKRNLELAQEVIDMKNKKIAILEEGMKIQADRIRLLEFHIMGVK